MFIFPKMSQMKVIKRKGENGQIIVNLIPCPDSMEKYINLVDTTRKKMDENG